MLSLQVIIHWSKRREESKKQKVVSKKEWKFPFTLPATCFFFFILSRVPFLSLSCFDRYRRRLKRQMVVVVVFFVCFTTVALTSLSTLILRSHKSHTNTLTQSFRKKSGTALHKRTRHCTAFFFSKSKSKHTFEKIQFNSMHSSTTSSKDHQLSA